MPDIHIRRDHTFGLTKARQLAQQWVSDAEKKFDMACTLVEGEDGDTVEFSRSGVTGQLLVGADHFEINATLGFLMGAFANMIEGEIAKNLDALLAKA